MLNYIIDKALQAVSELDVVKQQGKEIEEARKEILAMKVCLFNKNFDSKEVL